VIAREYLRCFWLCRSIRTPSFIIIITFIVCCYFCRAGLEHICYVALLDSLPLFYLLSYYIVPTYSTVSVHSHYLCTDFLRRDTSNTSVGTSTARKLKELRVKILTENDPSLIDQTKISWRKPTNISLPQRLLESAGSPVEILSSKQTPESRRMPF